MNKNTNRKIFAATASAALVATAVVPTVGFAEETGFSDVDADNEAASHVKDLFDAKVIEGYEDGTFQPGKSVTRAEVAQMITKIKGLNTDVPSADFSDVKKDVWYTDSINALFAAELIDGYEDGTYEPSGELTRAEFAKLVVNAYDIPIESVESKDLPFNDVKDGVWYSESIETLYANDLINGRTPTTFGPSDSIKRIDLALLLANVDYKFGDTLPKPGEDDEEVVELEVDSVSALDDIIVEFGGDYELPTNVDVTLSNDDVVSVPVTWEDTVDVNVAETYELEGALDLSDLEENVAETDLNATVNVVVEEEVEEVTDEEAAEEVVDMIKDLPWANNVTLEDKEAIEKARAAYEALSDEAKELVTNLDGLENREDALAELVDEAAEEVVEMIKDLPWANNVTLEDKDAIEEARAAYEALSDEAKELVTNLDGLENREDALAELEVAEAAEEAVKDFEAQVDSAEKVEELVADSVKRNEAMSTYVSVANAIQKLDSGDAKEALQDRLDAANDVLIAAGSVDSLQGATEDLTEDNVEAAKKAVTKAQNFVDTVEDGDAKDTLQGLIDAAQNNIDDFEAPEKVVKMIKDLPWANNVTLEDKDAIVEARAAYDALSDEAKKLVMNLNGLENREVAITELEEETAGEAQADFLAELEAKVENIDTVAEVEIDGEAIDVKFASDVSPQDVKNAAKGLVTALGNDINSGALTIGGNEFNLTDDKVVTRSATAILKGVSPVDFLTSGTLVNSGYTATITDNEDVEFDLAGTLKFTATNK